MNTVIIAVVEQKDLKDIYKWQVFFFFIIIDDFFFFCNVYCLKLLSCKHVLHVFLYCVDR